MKREAKFTTTFRHWLKANPMESAAFELKQAQGDSIAFSAVQPHQLDALMAAKDRALIFKIPDDSAGVKPFDVVYLSRALAYVVIRYPSFFVLIDVDEFVVEKETSTRKSLLSSRAKAIAKCIVEL
jgi:hypothetical protein